MKNAEFRLLEKVSDLLIRNLNTESLTENLISLLKEYTSVQTLNIYVLDETTNTLRNCSQSWSILENSEEEYKAFSELEEYDFVINSKAYKLPQVISDITFKINSLSMPIIKNEKIFGMIKLDFLNDTTIDTQFLFLMKIFAAQVSLKLQNIVLNEQSKVNVEFHDAMKNIAKIIETQYELNYIVPLIGEMLDRFISDHLIYVFLRQDNEMKLIWPKACNDARVYEVLGQITDGDYILNANKKIGAFPLLSEEGEIIGGIVARSTLDELSVRDISYLEQLTRQSAITINRANTYSKVLQYATLDALTNLNNRRQFEVRLKQEIATTKRQKNPLCAMMIDIDFFKKVNDTYGHACGDTVLRTVAQIIKEQLRESDIPSRYGGEEFAVLLPYTYIDDAKIVGERLRRAIEAKEMIFDDKLIKVTISMGIAEYDNIESGENLFERADKALYMAKTSGRNQIKLQSDL